MVDLVDLSSRLLGKGLKKNQMCVSEFPGLLFSFGFFVRYLYMAMSHFMVDLVDLSSRLLRKA